MNSFAKPNSLNVYDIRVAAEKIMVNGALTLKIPAEDAFWIFCHTYYRQVRGSDINRLRNVVLAILFHLFKHRICNDDVKQIFRGAWDISGLVTKGENDSMFQNQLFISSSLQDGEEGRNCWLVSVGKHQTIMCQFYIDTYNTILGLVSAEIGISPDALTSSSRKARLCRFRVCIAALTVHKIKSASLMSVAYLMGKKTHSIVINMLNNHLNYNNKVNQYDDDCKEYQHVFLKVLNKIKDL